MESPPTTLRILESAIRTLDLVILTRPSGDPEQVFELKSPSPPWFPDIFGSPASLTERSLFLEDFCQGAAQDCWQGESELEKSAPWQEDLSEGNILHFEATATQEAEQDILLITNVTERHQQDQVYLQSAHESLLNQRKISKEREKKEILLDCIVRELGSPLSTILMNVQFAKTQSERPELREALERAETQAERQRNLIHAVSHLFQAELNPLASTNFEEKAISLSQLAQTVVENYRPTANQKDISISLRTSDDALFVSATETHLQRVFQNLLEFTLSNSPAKQSISIELTQKNTSIQASFTNQATPISSEEQSALLHPFTCPNPNSPESPPALHLYFCRMMIEVWGGSIGIKSSSRGNRIWFELPQSATTNSAFAERDS